MAMRLPRSEGVYQKQRYPMIPGKKPIRLGVSRINHGFCQGDTHQLP